MNISVVGTDLVKNVFQLCALGANSSAQKAGLFTTD
jgi:hypothetical protein